MLAIDQQPVEPGVRAQFGHIGIAQRDPQPEQFLAARQRVLEAVFDHANIIPTLPKGPKSAAIFDPGGHSIGRMNDPASTTCPASIVWP